MVLVGGTMALPAEDLQLELEQRPELELKLEAWMEEEGGRQSQSRMETACMALQRGDSLRFFRLV